MSVKPQWGEGSMESLMTPTTAFIYTYTNLDSSHLPRTSPEDDVFARAFGQATPVRGDTRSAVDAFSLGGKGPDNYPRNEMLPDKSIFGDFLVPGSLSPFSESDLSSAGTRSNGRPSIAGASAASAETATQDVTHASRTYEAWLEASPSQGPAVMGDASAGGQQYDMPGMLPPGEEARRALGASDQRPVSQEKRARRRGTKRKIRSKDEEALRRKEFLERNRMAAQKCRSKKKYTTSTLEENLAAQEERNLRLKAEVEDLTAELGQLRKMYAQCEHECRESRTRRESGGEDHVVQHED